MSKHVGQPVDFVWHQETDLRCFDAVIVPGGFSYGDYLRAGALARFSPVMNSIKQFAADGKFVFGICNGFQILCEAGLLPGALMRNRSLHFICKHVNLRLENQNTPFTSEVDPAKLLSIPIAHAEGNYTCDDATFNSLEENGQIVFRYCDDNGDITDAVQPKRCPLEHRRHLQPKPQRPRHDAAPRTSLRRNARLKRRPRHFPIPSQINRTKRLNRLRKQVAWRWWRCALFLVQRFAARLRRRF